MKLRQQLGQLPQVAPAKHGKLANKHFQAAFQENFSIVAQKTAIRSTCWGDFDFDSADQLSDHN